MGEEDHKVMGGKKLFEMVNVAEPKDIREFDPKKTASMIRTMPGDRMETLGAERLASVAKTVDSEEIIKLGNERLGAIVKGVETSDIEEFDSTKLSKILDGMDHLNDVDKEKKNAVLKKLDANFFVELPSTDTNQTALGDSASGSITPQEADTQDWIAFSENNAKNPYTATKIAAEGDKYFLSKRKGANFAYPSFWGQKEEIRTGPKEELQSGRDPQPTTE